MPSPQALEALKILGGYQNPAIDLAGMREDRLAEMKRNRALSGGGFSTGATGADIADLEGDIAGDPYTGDVERKRTQDVLAQNAEIANYNRPDVTAIRQQQEENALHKLILPAQVKGQYDVAAAKAHADAQAAQTAMLIGGRQQVAETNQGGQDARAAANAKSLALRQRLQALQTGKAHAARPGGIYDSLFGPQQKTLDQAEIAQLMGQISGDSGAADMGGGETPAVGAAATPARPSAQDIIRRRLGR